MEKSLFCIKKKHIILCIILIATVFAYSFVAKASDLKNFGESESEFILEHEDVFEFIPDPDIEYTLESEYVSEETWLELLPPISDNKTSIVLIIDMHYSLYEIDPLFASRKILQNYIDLLGPNTDIAIVPYTQRPYVYNSETDTFDGSLPVISPKYDLTKNKDSIKNAIGRVGYYIAQAWHRGSDISYALDWATQYLENSDAENKYIVAVSHGKDTFNQYSKKHIKQAISEINTSLYSIVFGDTNNEMLEYLSTSIDGKYSYVSNIDMSSVDDTDNDGLPDFVEAQNPTAYGFGKQSVLSVRDSDYDDDGLSDGEELRCIYTQDGRLALCIMRSNPNHYDSDGDSYSDYIEVDTYGTYTMIPNSICDPSEWKYLKKAKNFGAEKYRSYYETTKDEQDLRDFAQDFFDEDNSSDSLIEAYKSFLLDVLYEISVVNETTISDKLDNSYISYLSKVLAIEKEANEHWEMINDIQTLFDEDIIEFEFGNAIDSINSNLGKIFEEGEKIDTFINNLYKTLYISYDEEYADICIRYLDALNSTKNISGNLRIAASELIIDIHSYKNNDKDAVALMKLPFELSDLIKDEIEKKTFEELIDFIDRELGSNLAGYVKALETGITISNKLIKIDAISKELMKTYISGNFSNYISDRISEQISSDDLWEVTCGNYKAFYNETKIDDSIRLLEKSRYVAEKCMLSTINANEFYTEWAYEHAFNEDGILETNIEKLEKYMHESFKRVQYIPFKETNDTETEIILPLGISIVSCYAHANKPNVQNVIISPTVSSIENYAFENCSNLTKVEVPKNVIYIGEKAFKDCPELEIHGYSGTYAELFANKLGIPFVDLEAMLPYIGDLTGDSTVDMSDAVLLLQHSMFPELFPLEYQSDVDFTKDGVVDMNDAILLLQHSIFPDLYPIE